MLISLRGKQLYGILIINYDEACLSIPSENRALDGTEDYLQCQICPCVVCRFLFRERGRSWWRDSFALLYGNLHAPTTNSLFRKEYLLEERLEFEYEGFKWFSKAQLCWCLEKNHCVFMVNFLSCFWVAFLRISHQSSWSAGSWGQSGWDPGLALIALVQCLNSARPQDSKTWAFSIWVWLCHMAASLRSLSSVLVPEIGTVDTVDTSAVSTACASCFFFLFAKCWWEWRLSSASLRGVKKPRETKFWYE